MPSIPLATQVRVVLRGNCIAGEKPMSRIFPILPIPSGLGHGTLSQIFTCRTARVELRRMDGWMDGWMDGAFARCTSQSHMFPFGILCIEHIDQCFASAQAKTAPSLLFSPPHTSSASFWKCHLKNKFATWTRQLACALPSIWGLLNKQFLFSIYTCTPSSHYIALV